MTVAKKGDLVFVHYTGSFESGEIFDTSAEGEPLYFIIGEGDIIEGFDIAITGMTKGEKKSIVLTPDQAYGEYEEERMITTSLESFGEDFHPEIGQQLAIQLQDTERAMATIIEFDDQEVTLDMNHPMAGKTLKFDLELVDIKDASEMPKKSSCEGGCGSCGGCS